MRVCLAYIYGPRNAGDMALNLGAIDLLKQISGIEIIGISRFAKEHDGYQSTVEYINKIYKNIEIVPFPINYDRNKGSSILRISAFCKGSMLYFPTIKHPLLTKTEVYKIIESSDWFVFNGGNLLFSRGFKDNLRLQGILYPIRLAEKLSKPIGLLPQSIPSLNNAWGQKIVYNAIKKSKFCMFRESSSAEKIFNKRQSEGKVFLDLAFFIGKNNDRKANELINKYNLAKGRFIPIILRVSSLGDQGTLSKIERNQTLELVKSIVKVIETNGLKTVFVVQTVQDKEFTSQCREDILSSGINAPIIEEYDPLILRSIYKFAHSVISFRLHAAIFSLSVGTKTLGIYREIWGPKMPGIFKDLGLKDFCFNIEKNADLQNLVTVISSKIKETIPLFDYYVSDKINSQKEKILLELRRHLIDQRK